MRQAEGVLVARCPAAGRRAVGFRKHAPVVVGLLAAALVSGSCSRARHVVVYTSIDDDLSAWVEDAFEHAHPDIDLRFEAVPSASLVERLEDERTAPAADVVWGAPSWVLAEAGARGLLDRHQPSWAASLPEGWSDPAGRWTANIVDPLVVAFNLDTLSRGRAPRDWIDLQHPRFQGEVLLPEPGVDDGATLLFASRAAASHAQYGDIVDVVRWFVRLDGQVVGYAPDEAEMMREVARGAAWVAPARLSAAERERAAGTSLDYVVPESGTPLLIQGVGMVSGAPDRAAAESLIEWLGSDEASDGFVARMRMPARPYRGTAPAWLAETTRDLHAEVTPADSVAAHLDVWLARWRSDVRGRGTRLLLP